MRDLTEGEKKHILFLYPRGWSPDEITEKILSERAFLAFKDMNMQVHRFLSIEFEKQMYPVEVYGKLKDIKKEEKDNGNTAIGFVGDDRAPWCCGKRMLSTYRYTVGDTTTQIFVGLTYGRKDQVDSKI